MPVAIDFQLNSPLRLHSTLVFLRLLRFLPSLNILSALTAGASTALLQMPEFHPSSTPVYSAAEGLLTVSAASAVISIMLATMLLFRFEGHETATRMEYIQVWSPLVLLDHSILAFLAGLLTWYVGKNYNWRAVVMAGVVGSLIVYSGFIAVGMYQSLHRENGLGREEIEKSAHARRVASGEDGNTGI
ncbi:hypothetical protein MMC25_000743 [Agyrium rufum]|nr:hypothetical protein [Agyrium rufum]